MKYARENDFDQAIQKAEAAYGVPAWVLKTTIAKESSFNPAAKLAEPDGRVSRGLMQLLEATARDRGYRGIAGNDDARAGGLYDPDVSIEFGARHLRWLRHRWPRAGWDAIYAAYNSGGIRTDAAGRFVTKGGDPRVQIVVDQWRRIADYFNPGWAPGRPIKAPAPSGPAPAA